jgi:hypothetical protein
MGEKCIPKRYKGGSLGPWVQDIRKAPKVMEMEKGKKEW